MKCSLKTGGRQTGRRKPGRFEGREGGVTNKCMGVVHVDARTDVRGGGGEGGQKREEARVDLQYTRKQTWRVGGVVRFTAAKSYIQAFHCLVRITMKKKRKTITFPFKRAYGNTAVQHSPSPSKPVSPSPGEGLSTILLNLSIACPHIESRGEGGGGTYFREVRGQSAARPYVTTQQKKPSSRV